MSKRSHQESEQRAWEQWEEDRQPDWWQEEGWEHAQRGRWEADAPRQAASDATTHTTGRTLQPARAGIEGIDSGGLCPNPGALTPPYLTTTTSAGVGLFGTQRSQASAAGAAGTSDHAMMGTADTSPIPSQNSNPPSYWRRWTPPPPVFQGGRWRSGGPPLYRPNPTSSWCYTQNWPRPTPGIVLSTPMARTRPTHTGGSPGFSFGASNNNAAKPGNLFGQTFGTPAPATESFGVGATSSAATGQTSPSFSFGNTAASTSAPSAFGVVGQAPPAAGSHPPGHLRGLLNGGVNMEASSSQLVTGMLGAFGPHAFNAVEQASEMGDDNDDSYEDGAVGLEEPDTASAKSNPTAHIDGVGSITASERPGIYPDRGRVLIRNFFSRATQQQWDQAAEIANTGETTIGANCPMCWNGVREPLRALCPPCGRLWHSLTPRPFHCTHPGCDSSFQQKADLDAHATTHDENRERLYQCGQCEKAFFTSRDLATHTRLHATPDRPHVCEICGRTFRQKGNLAAHMPTHDKNRERSIICEVCGKAFYDQRGLKTHAKTHTDRERAFVCKVCEAPFFSQQNLERHMATHDGDRERSHLCPICGKGFYLLVQLERHIPTHNDDRERPHVCGVCGIAYLSTWDLDRHVRHCHPDK